jgi:hypothetical protein
MEIVEAFAVLLFAGYVVTDRLDPVLGVRFEDLRVIDEQLQDEHFHI